MPCKNLIAAKKFKQIVSGLQVYRDRAVNAPVAINVCINAFAKEHQKGPGRGKSGDRFTPDAMVACGRAFTGSALLSSDLQAAIIPLYVCLYPHYILTMSLQVAYYVDDIVSNLLAPC